MDRLARLIGNRLREIRKLKGLRQEDVEDFGISYKYYQRIESGNVNVTLKTLEKVSAALDIDSLTLLSLPLDKSPEINELVAVITEIIKKNDIEAAKKANLFFKEFLL